MFQAGDILRHHDRNEFERGPWTGVDLQFIRYHDPEARSRAIVRELGGQQYALMTSRLRLRDEQPEQEVEPAAPEFSPGDRVVVTVGAVEWDRQYRESQVTARGGAMEGITPNHTVLEIEEVFDDRHGLCYRMGSEGYVYPAQFLAPADEASRNPCATQPQQTDTQAQQITVYRGEEVMGYCGARGFHAERQLRKYVFTSELHKAEGMDNTYIHQSLFNLLDDGYSWVLEDSRSETILRHILADTGEPCNIYSYKDRYPKLVVPTGSLRDTEEDFSKVGATDYQINYSKLDQPNICSGTYVEKDTVPAPIPLFDYYREPCSGPIFLLHSSWCRPDPDSPDTLKAYGLSNFIHTMQTTVGRTLLEAPIKINKYLYMQAVCAMVNPSEGYRASVALMFTPDETPIQVEEVG